MSLPTGLPFNSYSQLRYRGNEYVTDQTLNRTVYRLFQNDVHLDNKLQEHVSDNSVHYAESETTLIDYLTSDKLVILPGKNTDNGYVQTEDIIDDPNFQTYSEKSWQRLIDEQPKNLGGNTLTFRFQQSANQGSNPGTPISIKIIDMLKFNGFYGGNLIIESPAAFDPDSGNTVQNSSSAANQNLVIKSKGNSNAVISIENCHCKVTVRNSCFMLSDIIASSVKNVGNNGTNDFSAKLDSEMFENGDIYCNYPDSEVENNDGKYECKRYSAVHNKWYDLNMMTAIRIVNTSDVEIRHCYIKF